MSNNAATLIETRLSKIATGAALDAMRSNVVKTQLNVDEDIHVWLLSEIKEIEKHRNPTKLNQTVSQLTGTGARVTAIHQFIQTFCNVRMTNNTKQPGEAESERVRLSTGPDGKKKDWTVFYVVKAERKELSFFVGRKDGKAQYSTPIKYNRQTEKGMEEYLKLAAAKPWWEFRPEPEVRPFDFDNVTKGIANSLKRTFAAVHAKGSFEGTNPDFIAAVYAAVNQYYPDLTKDITEALEGELPKDAPEEMSNVIKFPAKPKENGEAQANVNASPNPKRVGAKK